MKISDFGVKRNSCELSNGTEVVVFAKPNAPISILVTFFSGERFDPKGKEGTAHFLEHMLVAGTEKFPTKDKIATYIESLGGINGASVGVEMFNIRTEIGDSADLKDAFLVLSEELNHSLFDDETLEKERKSIYNELAGNEANPNRVLYKNVLNLAYRGADVTKAVNQTKETVAKITKEDLLDYKKRFICGNRMAVIVAGDVTLAEVKDLVEDCLFLDRGDSFSLALPRKVRNEKVDITEFSSLKEQVKMELTFRIDVPYLNNVWFVLKVLNTVLGGGRASILYKKLRYERGLVYYVGSESGVYLNIGGMGIGAESGKSDLDEVLEIIKKTLKDLKQTGLSEEQLRFAKDKIIKSSKRGLQSSGSWVGSHKYSTLAQKFVSEKPPEYKNKIYTIEDFYRNIEKVTNESILEVSGKYLTSDNWFLSLVGSGIDRGKYRKIEFNV